jgi:hypothetical protein
MQTQTLQRVDPARRGLPMDSPNGATPTRITRRVTRLRLGTNTMRALIVNGKPAVAVAPNGVYIHPRHRDTLTATIAGETAYVAGTIPVKGVTIVIAPDGIRIAGIGTIAGEEVTELRLAVDDDARVRIDAVWPSEQPMSVPRVPDIRAWRRGTEGARSTPVAA